MDSNTSTHEHFVIDPGHVERLRSQLGGQAFLLDKELR